MPIAILFTLSGFFSFIILSFLSSQQIEPIYTLYYIFAWWCYIFFIDGIIYILKGDSLIISRTKNFLLMLPVSSAIWFIFEIINIRLKNWQYINLPFDENLRYFGYIISYATVLPAIFETTEFIETLGIFQKIKIKSINIKEEHNKKLLYSGLIMFSLTLLLPKYFFPLIWLCFIFIIEPINYRLSLPSIIREIRAARWIKIFNLFFAGLICGILWEMWNFNAGAKWIYNIPFVGKWKIFEMPLLGYLGFPVFALECYSIYNLFSFLNKGINWEEERQEPIEKLKKLPNYYLYILFILFIPLYFLSIKLIDTHSVKLFKLI